MTDTQIQEWIEIKFANSPLQKVAAHKTAAHILKALNNQWYATSVFMPSRATQELKFKVLDGTIYEGKMILASWYWYEGIYIRKDTKK